jgi:hypothetical protein
MRLAVWSVILAGVAAFASPAHAETRRSIVGLWSSPEGSCRFVDGATRIGPRSLDNTDITCRFDTVERKGSRVIWTGTCDDAEGSSRQTVTASEADGELTIRYEPGGNLITGMKRCGAE